MIFKDLKETLDENQNIRVFVPGCDAEVKQLKNSNILEYLNIVKIQMTLEAVKGRIQPILNIWAT